MVAATDAWALLQRTFVASYGSDVNPCTRASPCRGFAAALVQTASGGELIVLDSAGYGPVVIRQSVAIVAPAGVYAGVSVSSGNGIDVGGAGAQVTLRGLSINGIGGLSNAGILFGSGNELHVEDCTVTNFANIGIQLATANATVSLRNVLVRGNVYGLFSSGAGLQIYVDRSRIENNINGLNVVNGVTAAVTDSAVVNNGTNILVNTTTSGLISTLAISTSSIASDSTGDGIQLTASPGAMTVLSATRNTFVSNNHGIQVGSVGTGVVNAWIVENTIINSTQIGIVRIRNQHPCHNFEQHHFAEFGGYLGQLRRKRCGLQQ